MDVLRETPDVTTKPHWHDLTNGPVQLITVGTDIRFMSINIDAHTRAGMCPAQFPIDSPEGIFRGCLTTLEWETLRALLFSSPQTFKNLSLYHLYLPLSLSLCLAASLPLCLPASLPLCLPAYVPVSPCLLLHAMLAVSTGTFEALQGYKQRP